ncbi:MAG: universal stress protein, partial [Bacteroidota bacterium]
MKIVVPTDFSKNSIDALHYAAEIALAHEGELHIVTAYEKPYSTRGSLVSLRKKLERDAEDKMEKLKAKLNEREKMPRFEVYVREDSPVELVVRAVEHLEASLVVMGTKGASGLQGYLMGSTASAVIEKSPCPVLAVPAGATFEGWSNIVYAADLQDANPQFGKELLNMSAPFGSAVRVVHVTSDTDGKKANATMDELKSALTAESGNRTMHFDFQEGKDIQEGIFAYIEANSSDLLAMVTKRRTLIGKLFDRSLTTQLA